jgi:hypothetical protein
MTKRAASTPTPAEHAGNNFAVALVELGAKLLAVRQRRDAVIAERLVREGNGEHLAKPLAGLTRINRRRRCEC